MSGSPLSPLADFALELDWTEVPSSIREHVHWLLADFGAVVAAGRPAPTARIAAEHAATVYGGDQATGLLDGRRLSAPGAAFANGVLANALDLDDGHSLTKGHPGAVVIPAALAAAQLLDATADDFRAAVLVGYEVAIRTAIYQHATAPAYHGTGSWGAVGAAAATCRLIGASPSVLSHALGLAEYHAPMSPIMRSVAEPAMTKDGIAWGCFVGLSSVLLAARGFTATPSDVTEDVGPWKDLGSHWRVLETYVKPYPCCRWAQPSIHAALRAYAAGIDAGDPAESATILTFAPAADLSRTRPSDGEQAQYNLVWPVAVALRYGRFGVDEALGAVTNDNAVAEFAERIDVKVDTDLDAAFPVRRRSRLLVTTSGGRLWDSGAVEAPGEPGDADWRQIIYDKLTQAGLYAGTSPSACLATADREGLLAVLIQGVDATRPPLSPGAGTRP